MILRTALLALAALLALLGASMLTLAVAAYGGEYPDLRGIPFGAVSVSLLAGCALLARRRLARVDARVRYFNLAAAVVAALGGLYPAWLGMTRPLLRQVAPTLLTLVALGISFLLLAIAIGIFAVSRKRLAAADAAVFD